MNFKKYIKRFNQSVLNVVKSLAISLVKPHVVHHVVEHVVGRLATMA
jgi:hypothetical protein